MESKVRGGDEEEDEERQKVERLVEKLKKNNRNNRPSTPAHVSFVPNPIVSSRKLAAAFWEFHQYYDEEEDCSHSASPADKMHRGANGFVGTSNRRQRHGKTVVKENNGLDLSQFLRDPSPEPQPDSAGSLRRQIGQMLIKHHQSIERHNHALQPVSPASYGSSLEVATYNEAVTPSSSLEFRGRTSREPHYNLKTSTELLKVLNRIWSLEEQHVANISLIKALKTEVAHSRVRIKELLRYQQADRHELDSVVKQLAEEKMLRKNKDVERISSAVQSVRKELEDERKLRKRSESLHRKMARELSEVKSSLSSCVNELERGAKSNKMMELLCDEFAKGIKTYEEEIHGLKKKNLDKDWASRAGGDQMVLQIAESWLDERMQMRLEGGNTLNGNHRSVVDKLEVEIETFLQEKRNENPRNRRNSLESVPFNALSAPPRDVDCEEEDSAGSESNCFELKKPIESLREDTDQKPNQPSKDDLLCDEKPKGKLGSPSSFLVKFEDQMAWAMSSNGKKKNLDIEDKQQEDAEPDNKPKDDEIDQCATSNKNDVMGEMIRTHRRLLSETREIDEASSSFQSSSRRQQASPIRQWTSRTITPDLLGSSDIAIALGVKDNTLKTKLAKSSKSRLRLFKG